MNINPEICCFQKVENNEGYPGGGGCSSQYQQSSRMYLALPTHEGSGIVYSRKQRSELSEEEGMSEGRMWIERKLTMTRLAFAAAVFNSLSLWNDCGTFYMINGSSPYMNKFRGAVVIADDTLPCLEIEILKEKGFELFGKRDEKKRLVISLLSFSKKAWEIILNEGMICLPESLGSQLDLFQGEFSSYQNQLKTGY
ncbi:MAG: hypothetical protein WCO18_01780 [bacterium]